ncbi:phosphoenolpyruvate-dependent sugar phosphotransferase system eiia 2 [Lucifera butyrica]|uniref:Phosphoenolpyruvate-dependent sugar phosphotransferase system eiia 2 n=1 Tax=Lucifera butyrica TaxID=1351585 RepID=A0A498RD80_9FIRM|nr:PTS sugar transporter subunit IIA [Lucifera butyrica]VBB07148.1 phosphoenolpyruvate-dependent sugar phosphotransferase system eiia 2 [Lucifera butyrica]
MDLLTVIDESRINLELDAANKAEAINALVDMLMKSGVLSSKEKFIQDVYLREAEGKTGIGGGIAIPHGKSKSVLKTSLAIGRTKRPIFWESLDDQPVRCIVLFAVRDVDSTTMHVKLLGEFAGKLADEQVVEKLLTSTQTSEIIDIFSEDK